MSPHEIARARNVIKGRIAEAIFAEMFAKADTFTILRSGYEHLAPLLAQYQQDIAEQRVLTTIRTLPDFILLSHNQTKREAYLVEVKYRADRNPTKIAQIAKDLRKFWNPSWLFVASPDGFFFSPCNQIIHDHGHIGPLYEKWVARDLQAQCLTILNEFAPPHAR